MPGDAHRGLPRRRPRGRSSPAGASSRRSRARTGAPVVVAGFEPLDILAALVKLAELVRDGRPEVVNMYPRCVTREGNLAGAGALWKVFRAGGRRLARHRRGPRREPRPARRSGRTSTRAGASASTPRAVRDARRRGRARRAASAASIMLGLAIADRLRALRHGPACPTSPVGACMVSLRGAVPHLAHVRRRRPTSQGGGHVMEKPVANDRAEARRRAGARCASSSRTCSSPLALAGGRRSASPRSTTARRSGSATAGSSSRPTRTSSTPIFFPGGDIGRLAVSRHRERPRDDGRDRAARRSPAR